MKAIVWTQYGSPDGLQLREVETPTPKENEVLIKVHAATASTPDTEFRRLKLPLLFVDPSAALSGFQKTNQNNDLGNGVCRGDRIRRQRGNPISARRPGVWIYRSWYGNLC